MTDPYRLALAECDTAFRTQGPHAFRSWLDQKCLETNATIINERRVAMKLKGIAIFDGWKPTEDEIEMVQVVLLRASGGGNWPREIWNNVPYEVDGKRIKFSIELTQGQVDPREDEVTDDGAGAGLVVNRPGRLVPIQGVIKWL